jgi:hypothetical protein
MTGLQVKMPLLIKTARLSDRFISSLKQSQQRNGHRQLVCGLFALAVAR